MIVKGKVLRVERMGTSRFGNPYFMVAIETATGEVQKWRTQIDSSINYAIDNPEYKERAHAFKLTRAGRIFGATLIS